MTSGRTRGAFTLVEVLLVLAILAVITAITVPAFMNSMRGNRLRSAGRTVVMAARYARSMALLDQCEITETFHLDRGSIELVSHDTPPPPPQETGTVETAVTEARTRQAQEDAITYGTATAAAPASATGDDTSPATNAVAGPTTPTVSLVRVLDGVSIESVRLGDQGSGVDTGGVAVVYRTNGRCDPYTVVLRDPQHDGLRIEVDALATPRVERDDP